jgi:hypothetical protein
VVVFPTIRHTIILMRRDGQGKRSFPANGPVCLAPQWIARITR